MMKTSHILMLAVGVLGGASAAVPVLLVGPAAVTNVVRAATSAPPAQSHAPFDARVEWNRWFEASPRSSQRQAIDRLQSSNRGIVATFDSRTGATRTLLRRGGYLTLPSPWDDPIVVARRFVEAHLEHLGLMPGDVAGLEITDVVYSKVTGATHICFRQKHAGISVYNGQLQVNVNRDGRILSLNNSFVPDLAAAAGAPVPRGSAAEAAISAAEHLKIPLPLHPLVLAADPTPDRRTKLRGDGLSRIDIEARLMWLPIRSGEARLVGVFEKQRVRCHQFVEIRAAPSGTAGSSLSGQGRTLRAPTPRRRSPPDRRHC